MSAGEVDRRPAEADPPDVSAVLRAQLRLMARAHRPAFLLLGLAVAAGVVALAWIWPGGAPDRLTLAHAMGRSYGALELVAVFWAAMVTWRGEGPEERFHHWSQPVGRRRHQLLRIAAGAVWLLAAVVAGAAAGWLAGAVVQGGMGPGGAAPLAATVGGLLLLYLLGSVPALLSEHPVVWIVGVYAGTGFLVTLASARGWPLAGTVRSLLLTGDWSLSSATNAPGLLVGGTSGGQPWAALGLWLCVAGAAVVLTASVHQERSAGG